jgi:RimJ/RimL family protein N-acetyltransferase
MKLLFGHDKIVADWVSKKSGTPLRNWHHAVGIINDGGELVGCASFHDINGSNVELCFWGPRAVTPNVARGIMRFAFDILKMNRLTAKTPRQNKTVSRHLGFYGFRCEGLMRHYYGPKKRLDAVVFGLLAEDGRRFLERHAR